MKIICDLSGINSKSAIIKMLQICSYGQFKSVSKYGILTCGELTV